MGEFSDRMALKAREIITKRGEQAVLTRTPRGKMTASGDRPSSEQPVPARVAFFPGEGEVLTEGRTRSASVLMEALDPPPRTGQTITVASGLNAGVWHIDKIDNLGPEGTLIYSKAEVSA